MISDNSNLDVADSSRPTDPDLSFKLLDPGESKTSDVQNPGDGDSGASLSYNNNILSPILSASSGTPFSDNLTSLPNFVIPESYVRSKFVMEDTIGQRNEKSESEVSKTVSSLHKQLEWMQKNMEMLKKENASLENTLAKTLINQSPQMLDSRGTSTNSAFVFSNFKMEMASFKTELARITSCLESCELCRKTFLERWTGSLSSNLQQMSQSLKELLLRNLENPAEDVLMESLASRLKSTEERLKRTRADMSESLSREEEKMLIENVELKISENEAKRKLQQSANQIQSLRKSHQGLMEVCQRLKVRSSENGFIDFQELLRRFPTEDPNLKRSEDVFSREAIEQIKEDVIKQINDLAKEKHLLSSELSGCMDEINFLTKENSRLRKSVNELNTSFRENMTEFQEAQSLAINKLMRRMEEFTGELQQLCRCGEAAYDTIRVLEDVINTKERFLSSSLMELEKYKSSAPIQSRREPQETRQDSEHLTAILEFMKLKASNEEGSAAMHDPMEDFFPSANNFTELSRLNEKCLMLEHELEFAEKNLQFQKDEVESLQAQLNASRDGLRQKTQELEISLSNESDLRRELKMNREWLDVLNAQIIEKEKQMKLLELDKGSIQRLIEKEGVSETGESGETDVIFIKQALELDLMATRNALDSSLKENLLLKKSIDQASRDLAAERDVTSAATYDKLLLQQQLYAARQEVDSLLKERDEMRRKNSLLQLENQKLSASHSRGQSAEPVTGLQERAKALSSELQETKRKLEIKERDSAFFQDTLKFVLKSKEDYQAKKES